ncbi:bifunctional 2',3'-cyclic-nucleotide 2'-phosphodiesterase/3'-nucleotidase [Undibacterium sp.]|uniref:bifunctional 2',3'-cyclic-nucleotide 2'-phosphodiesterase/3'-nucleotidase n=1 Tax=Undibacterium sp. TaxID=1914977 RepID=UPI002BC38600|nr:bifunctional 2',3'-cyclic-nucleotide 2'-phosphodiesterase/3'-nucleotidase [Undibacterium sp.]HTD04963.1 bifunctional 2',3'-cyclic-nucleotide 2'-phosphodiesterase/3'-nucleotidase [Undibacterium sp.]
MKFTRYLPLLAATAVAFHLSACSRPEPAPIAATIAAGTTVELALLETTDLHTNIRSYDYYKLKEDPSIGFERTLSLVRNARAEFANTLLFDNGDAIQGTALADYQAIVKPLDCTSTAAMYKAMNLAGYDAASIGNHEFNYGLPFLAQVTGSRFNVDGMPAVGEQSRCAGPNFPMVLANLLSVKDGQSLYRPYVILDRKVLARDKDGRTVSSDIKVGVIGFTPPTVLNWDKRWLEGKVYTEGIREVAQKYVPEMRAKGADLVVAISHGGLDDAPYQPTMENGNYYLAQVAGIDAMLIGHSHQVFPNPGSTVAQFNLLGVDKARGLVHGVPTVMASFWGQHLGVIKLSLGYDGKSWHVDKSKTLVQARPVRNADGSFIAADPAVAPLIEQEHQATINYVKTPIGNTDFRMSSFFADLGDVSALQIINQAQAEYISAYIKANLPQYAGLPVLSVSSPFKSGFAGGNDYTDVAAGSMSINHAADLYLYPNTVYAVKVSGEDIRKWLETSALRFNRIDAGKKEPQNLIGSFAGYNFDMFTDKDVRYEIDVTQDAGQRIRHLSYRGRPIVPEQEFIVATNNYRASGGGNFPGLDGSKTIYASPDANRDVLIQYIKSHRQLSKLHNGSDRSWRFTRVTTAGPVTYRSAKDKLALAQAAGIANLSVLSQDDGSGKNMSVYQIDLSK